MVAILGALAFGTACALVDVLARHGLYGAVADALFVTPFWSDAVKVVGGAVPYRDFPLEYPPLGLPVFVLPAILPFGGTTLESYRTAFEVVVAGVGMAVVPVVVATVARLGGRRPDVLAAAGIVAVSPLLLGPLSISRYDLWPAVLTAGAVAALLWDRHRLGHALLGLGILAKVYPAFLVPIFAAWTWRRAGPRTTLAGLGVLLAVVAAGILPFAAVAPDGALAPFSRSVARPLQIESLGAAVLIALHDLVGLDVGRTTYEFESYNLAGPLPSLVATAQTLALGATLLGIWIGAARRPLSPERFVVACAAAIAAAVAFGKVLSPQYVLWLLPAVVVLGPPMRGAGRRLALLVAILALTAMYYPAAYGPYVARFDQSATVIILARNLAIVAVAADTAIAAGALWWVSRWLPGPRPPRRPGPPAGRAPAGA
ncbi:MAG TPA: glycosyltransferase 87 family protein [Candidatus Binatus sp.]|nr:glycosyltransferase 87 family protein [Candidatus Binatus sp.]